MNLRPRVIGRRCLVCGDCAEVQREALLEQGRCLFLNCLNFFKRLCLLCYCCSLCTTFPYFLSFCEVDVGFGESVPEVVQECGYSVDKDQGLLRFVCFFVLFH